MQLKTLLNRVQRHSSFVYETVRLVEHPRLAIEVEVRPRANARAKCSQCGRVAPGDDTLPPRCFAFVPLWHIPVVFLYAMRRVACARCGVKVESVPWATGKHRVTDTYAWFLAGWAKRLSWQEVATGFHSSWDTVYRSVRMAVEWGLAHRDLEGIEAIGIDELARRRGHRYLTLVYQLDRHCKRLLWIGRERKAETLHGFFFDELGAARSAALRFVCSDMWKPYLKVVAERAGQAVHVLDRFHIMSHFSKAIDEGRAAEARKLAAEGRAPVLKRSRWLLLKRPENLTDAQSERLAELVRRNLRTVRAWLLKEDFQALWEYVSPYWAGRFRPSSPRKRGPVVHPHDAFAARPDEEGRAHDALAPGVDLELVPRPGGAVQRHCGGVQRQGQSDHQKSVRSSDLRGAGNRVVSYTWRPARTRTHPQILLTRLSPSPPRAGARFNPPCKDPPHPATRRRGS